MDTVELFNDFRSSLEIAVEFKLSRHYVEILCKTGELSSKKIGGVWVVRRSSMLKKMSYHQQEPIA